MNFIFFNNEAFVNLIDIAIIFDANLGRKILQLNLIKYVGNYIN
jgi:hypothetical protein